MSKEMEDLVPAPLLATLRSARQDPDIGALTLLADRADAYVANTIEALCRIELSMPAHARSARQVEQLAEIKRRLETLEDLVTSLRGLAAGG